jgi:hypothetical protein
MAHGIKRIQDEHIPVLTGSSDESHRPMSGKVGDQEIDIVFSLDTGMQSLNVWPLNWETGKIRYSAKLIPSFPHRTFAAVAGVDTPTATTR